MTQKLKTELFTERDKVSELHSFANGGFKLTNGDLHADTKGPVLFVKPGLRNLPASTAVNVNVEPFYAHWFVDAL